MNEQPKIPSFYPNQILKSIKIENIQKNIFLKTKTKFYYKKLRNKNGF